MQKMLRNNTDQVLFKKILQNELGHQNFIIKQVKQDPLSSKAEHGLSDICRIHIRYIEDGEENDKNGNLLSLIVKKEPNTEGAGLDLIRKQGLFPTEIKFLWDVLPQLEERLGFRMGPKIFYSNENSDLIIMEDLGAKGYRLPDRQKGLSMQYALMAIDRLAKFHAASVSLFEDKPELIKQFKIGIMSRETHENMYKIVESTLSLLANSIIEKWIDQEAVTAAHKLLKMTENFENRIAKVYDYDDNEEFCVLNHGDCWHSNLLFKTNERGTLLDMLMIDYQMTIFTSPAIDLLYFLGICPAIDIKCEMDDYFLEVYLQTLKMTMGRICCKTEAPTMDQLKKAIYKRNIYAVFSSLIFYPRMIADEIDTETFDDILATGETKMDVFKNPDAIAAVGKIIKVLNQRGYLD
ncbi:uncharacterized protein LOC122509175 [Leptopilina heterotoma]|uniref:uncharacterized protein LOC122509175 n=1 Tax=Leptopilina heterotoma TaxID=63436 RepID=UPI001CA9C6F7|nr:uncharacterized protein LOC122509175 [Leptopilina heterotoma]